MTENTIEKYQFKITIAVSLMVILFIITMSVQLATWKTNVENSENIINERINYINTKYLEMTNQITILEDKAIARDIQLTEIKVKLTNIETLLVELKLDIKQIAR